MVSTLHEYTAAVYDAEEGGYWADVLELPGCVAQAESLQELQRNLVDAIIAFEETRREIDGGQGYRPVRTLSVLVEERDNEFGPRVVTRSRTAFCQAGSDARLFVALALTP